MVAGAHDLSKEATDLARMHAALASQLKQVEQRQLALHQAGVDAPPEEAHHLQGTEQGDPTTGDRESRAQGVRSLWVRDGLTSKMQMLWHLDEALCIAVAGDQPGISRGWLPTCWEPTLPWSRKPLRSRLPTVPLYQQSAGTRVQAPLPSSRSAPATESAAKRRDMTQGVRVRSGGHHRRSRSSSGSGSLKLAPLSPFAAAHGPTPATTAAPLTGPAPPELPKNEEVAPVGCRPPCVCLSAALTHVLPSPPSHA